MGATKIYTKTGDLGLTAIANGESLSKSSLQIDLCGTVDELNSYLGLTRQYIELNTIKEKILRIQQELQQLNSMLTLASSVERITMEQLKTLEKEIDQMATQIPEQKSFTIPGHNLTSAHLHVARTICRRTERAAVKLLLDQTQTTKLTEIALPYLNRLGDWLFIAARLAEKK